MNIQAKSVRCITQFPMGILESPLCELGCHHPLQDAQPQALLHFAVLRHAGQVGGLVGIVLQVEQQVRPCLRRLPRTSSACPITIASP